MKKIKLTIGVFAFTGLAVLNFTQSESCLVNKAIASSSNETGSSSTSDLGLSSTDDPNYAYCAKLSVEECTIKKINMTAGFRLKGIPLGVGAEYEVNGTSKNCTFWLFARCNQNDIESCHEV